MKFISLSSEQLFKTDQPVFFGVVYISPEYIKYSSEDAFSELEHIKRAFIVYLSDWYREKNKKRP
jgi:hypothetical protein